MDFPHPPLGLATKSKEPAAVQFTVTVLAGITGQSDAEKAQGKF